MKRSQNGSATSLFAFVVIAGLIYWKWDWIAGLFGSKLTMGGTVVELVNYTCDRQPSGRMAFDGRVRNTSDSPIGLRAVSAIYDSSGKKSDYSEASVRPSPLQPGQTGDFRGDASPLPDGGSCRLDGFVDSATGKTVGHSGRGR
jgi:hypothetical protein